VNRAAVASKCVVGLVGSDPNCERAAEGFWGRIPIRGTAFKLANKASPIWALTPIIRHPNNPGSFHPFMPSAMASKCVAEIDRDVSVFIFGPTHSPRPLPPRRAEEGANTTFGRVLKQSQYTCRGALKTCMNFGNLNLVPPAVETVLSSAAMGELMMSTCLSSEYFLALNTWPNMAVGSSFPPGGAGKGRGE